ncbi:MAG TPA: hypothetical protein VKU83_02880, partial [Puia sp.]|nr:hypothetical protein [Puia sp.]
MAVISIIFDPTVFPDSLFADHKHPGRAGRVTVTRKMVGDLKDIIPYNIFKEMNWQQLYSPVRTGSGTDSRRQDLAESIDAAGGTGSSGRGQEAGELRTSFLRDYDRIIFSSAFRRLQNKTQVFPLPGPVFVHNRLTHSLEVASVGRSLGKAVGDALAEKHSGLGENFREFYKYELASVIAAACLAHDI